MLPRFANQNPPVTPNNGNPNTVYNRKRVVPRFMGFNEFETLPDQPIGPVPDPAIVTDDVFPPAKVPDFMEDRSRGPVPGDAVPAPTFVSPEAVARPKPVPTILAVARPKPVPTILPAVPVAPAYGPSVGGEPLASAQTDSRTTLGQWLPRFVADVSGMGTQFGPGAASPGMDHWRARLAQIRQNDTNPVTAPPAATAPAVLVTPPPASPPATPPVTGEPSEAERLRDPGFQSDLASRFSSGNLAGFGHLLGVGTAQGRALEAGLARARQDMSPAARETLTRDAATISQPTSPPAARKAAWSRIMSTIGRVARGLGIAFKEEWQEFMEDLRDPIGALLDPVTWGNMLVPGAGSLIEHVMRSGQPLAGNVAVDRGPGTVDVGSVAQAPAGREGGGSGPSSFGGGMSGLGGFTGANTGNFSPANNFGLSGRAAGTTLGTGAMLGMGMGLGSPLGSGAGTSNFSTRRPLMSK